MGYADRRAALATPEARRLIGGGISTPIIVARGRVVGTWRRRIDRGEVFFETSTFTPLSKPTTEGVKRALRGYARFLSLEAGGIAKRA
jgi:hypothetical protein